MGVDREQFQKFQKEEAEVISEATQMTADQHYVLLTSTASYTLTLPALGDCSGFYYIEMPSRHATDAITLADAGDDPDWSNLTIDASKDNVLLFAAPTHWLVVDNNIA